MTVDFTEANTLLQTSVQEELYEKLVQQIEKDFKLANIPFDLPFKVTPKNLKTILHQKIYRLILDQFTAYLNLLYSIDVSEQLIKQITSEDPLQIADEVSFLILKREYQKVWFKRRYS